VKSNRSLRGSTNRKIGHFHILKKMKTGKLMGMMGKISLIVGTKWLTIVMEDEHLICE
jgi:hypothetical protein